jgi:hypothetical protein
MTDRYYTELLRFGEDLPTKLPPEEAPFPDERARELIELMDALRAANLEDNDIPLYTLLTRRGFGKVETYLLISLMVRRKKGPGRPTKDSILKLQAKALRDIKKMIKAEGIRSRIHEEAMKILERGHNRASEAALSEWGLSFDPFDRNRLENHIRRSRVRRQNSRAK